MFEKVITANKELAKRFTMTFLKFYNDVVVDIDNNMWILDRSYYYDQEHEINAAYENLKKMVPPVA